MSTPIADERARLRQRLTEIDLEAEQLKQERGKVVYALDVLARLDSVRSAGQANDEAAHEPVRSVGESSSRAATQRAAAEMARTLQRYRNLEPTVRQVVAALPSQSVMQRAFDAAEVAQAAVQNGGVDAAREVLAKHGSDVVAPRPVGAATHHYALEALKAFDEPVKVDQIVEQMREIGWESDAENQVESVRVALSRARANGTVVRPAYGLYALAKSGDSPDPDAMFDS